ncbi:MAG: TRAP transporter substrate-binding protein DctP, partial [Granulosicoccaceae bacterium]
PLDSLADLEGKKIRVGGGIQSVLAERMGITAVPAPGSKVYEILQQGVADGVFMPIGEQSTLRLSEVAKHVYTLPGGMYLGSFGIFAGAEFFDELDAADQEALMSVAGENLSRLAGAQWEANDNNGLAKAQEAGNEVVEVSADDLAAFGQITADLDGSFAEKVSDTGIDAAAALEFYRSTARGLE